MIARPEPEALVAQNLSVMLRLRVADLVQATGGRLVDVM